MDLPFSVDRFVRQEHQYSEQSHEHSQRIFRIVRQNTLHDLDHARLGAMGQHSGSGEPVVTPRSHLHY